MIEGHYLLSMASEAGVCFWTWTNRRQKETSSIACFRYALPIFFIYLTNESLSILEDFSSHLVVKAIAVEWGMW